MAGLWELCDWLTVDASIMHRTAETDEHGDRVFVTSGTVDVCAFVEPVNQRVASGEQTAGQTTTRATHLMVIEGDTVIGVHDLVTIDGEVFEVDGQPRRFRHVDPTGSGEHHVEADLVRTVG